MGDGSETLQIEANNEVKGIMNTKMQSMEKKVISSEANDPSAKKDIQDLEELQKEMSEDKMDTTMNKKNEEEKKNKSLNKSDSTVKSSKKGSDTVEKNENDGKKGRGVKTSGYEKEEVIKSDLSSKSSKKDDFKKLQKDVATEGTVVVDKKRLENEKNSSPTMQIDVPDSTSKSVKNEIGDLKKDVREEPQIMQSQIRERKARYGKSIESTDPGSEASNDNEKGLEVLIEKKENFI